jgi:hypothetical protein
MRFVITQKTHFMKTYDCTYTYQMVPTGVEGQQSPVIDQSECVYKDGFDYGDLVQGLFLLLIFAVLLFSALSDRLIDRKI